MVAETVENFYTNVTPFFNQNLHFCKEFIVPLRDVTEIVSPPLKVSIRMKTCNTELGVASTSCLSQQNERSRTQEHRDSSDKIMDANDENDNDNEEDPQEEEPVSNSEVDQRQPDSYPAQKGQNIDSVMVRSGILQILKKKKKKRTF